MCHVDPPIGCTHRRGVLEGSYQAGTMIMSPELRAIRQGLNPGIAINSQLIITIPAKPLKQSQGLYVRRTPVETQCGAENGKRKRNRTDPVWSPGGMESDCPTITKL
jgi:hypothetical protein